MSTEENIGHHRKTTGTHQTAHTTIRNQRGTLGTLGGHRNTKETLAGHTVGGNNYATRQREPGRMTLLQPRRTPLQPRILILSTMARDFVVNIAPCCVIVSVGDAWLSYCLSNNIKIRGPWGSYDPTFDLRRRTANSLRNYFCHLY